MTLGVRPCTSFTDFVCGINLYPKFWKDQVLANCSAECPAECTSNEFTLMQSFSQFPPPSFLYYLLGKSESLSQNHFNMSAGAFQNAMAYLRPDLVPSMATMQTTLRSKLVSLNIYYDELMYTHIKESIKFSVIDLVAGMGGTLVNLLFPSLQNLILFKLIFCLVTFKGAIRRV